MERTNTPSKTPAMRTVVAVFGVVVAISGISHGYWEVLQGNVATGGMFINSVGPNHVKWPIGSEPAFTLLPSFLVTGMAAILLGILAAIWSIFFVHRQLGSLILLLLFIAQSLVGGGLGYIPFYLTVCAYATRIGTPMSGLERLLPTNLRNQLTCVFLPVTACTAVLFLFLLETALYGFFWETIGSDRLINWILVSLILTMVLMNMAFVSAAASDIENKNNAHRQRQAN